jgi:hypothetical protein
MVIATVVPVTAIVTAIPVTVVAGRRRAIVVPIVATVVIAAMVVTAIIATVAVAMIVVAHHFARDVIRVGVAGGEGRTRTEQRRDESKSHGAFHLVSP